MDKTYSMKEIMDLFYSKILMKDFPDAPEIMKSNQEWFDENKSHVEKWKKNIESEFASYNWEKKDPLYGYRTKRELNRYNPNPIFDLVPIANFLNGIKYSGVYVKDKDGNLKDLSTGELISKDKINQKQGNILIITQPGRSDYEIKSDKSYYGFTVVCDSKLMSVGACLMPKRKAEGAYGSAITQLQAPTFIELNDSGIYIDKDKAWPKTLQVSWNESTDHYKKNYHQALTNLAVKIRSDHPSGSFDLEKEVFDCIPGLEQRNSLLRPVYKLFGLIINENEPTFKNVWARSGFNDSTYLNMLYCSNDIKRLYGKLSSHFGNVYSPGAFKEEIDNSVLKSDELDYIFSLMPKQDLKLDKMQDNVEDTKNFSEQKKNKGSLNESFLGESASKTRNQIINEAEVITQIKNLGIDLSPVQEQILYISEKLQSDEFKEFQAKRAERLQKQKELREKIMRDNEAKEEWQNSPNHIDNVRKFELVKLKNTIEALSKLKAINPSLLSNEQSVLLDHYIEFAKMY